jgi:hypothetical protein
MNGRGNPAGILLRDARIALSDEKSTSGISIEDQPSGTSGDNPYLGGRGEPDRQN